MKNKFLKYYTPFFCEENCWQLANSFSLQQIHDSYILFLTNEHKTIALANQQAVPEGEIVIWDYHVILYNPIQKLIYDFDSYLDFPCSSDIYFPFTFGNQQNIPEIYQTQIRAISAKDYIEAFDSDRSHMLGTNGQPLQKFPEWPAISNSELPLKQILKMKSEHKLISDYKPAADFFDRN